MNCYRINQVYMAEFDSITEIMDTAGKTGWAKCDRSTHSADEAWLHGESSWMNGVLASNVKDLMKDPPRIVRDTVREMHDALLEHFNPPQRRRRKRRRNQEMGDHLDEISWVTRRTDGWEDTHREFQPKQIVRIAVNIGATANLQREQHSWRGASACALADILTAQGKTVELRLYSAARQVSQRCGTTVITALVKEASAPLDMDAASFVLGEIGWFRRCVLPTRARIIEDEISWGMGSTTNVPDDVRERNIDILIDQNVRSKESAIALIQRYAEVEEEKHAVVH